MCQMHRSVSKDGRRCPNCGAPAGERTVSFKRVKLGSGVWFWYFLPSLLLVTIAVAYLLGKEEPSAINYLQLLGMPIAVALLCALKLRGTIIELLCHVRHCVECGFGFLDNALGASVSADATGESD